MGQNVSQKLIGSHLVDGRMEAGQEVRLKIDQTLTQDATGTMVMLELEAMNLSRVQTELSAQYMPLTFANPNDWEKIDRDDVLSLPDIRAAIQQGAQVKVINKTKGQTYLAEHALTGRQTDMILSGSLLNLMRKRHG